RVRKYTNYPKSSINPSNDSEIKANQPLESSEFTTEEDEVTSESDDNGNFEIFEDYASLDYEPFRDPPSTESIDDDRFLWILIWIMSFWTRFNITEFATEALIKFMKLVLTEIGVDLLPRSAEHFLAYIRWYQPADSLNIRYYFCDNEETCNV
ncbi:15491_t:CDS:2, partial [Funneliformis geosporum]